MIAVLFSGGADSLVHLHWAQQTYGRDRVVPAYFDIGHAYAVREQLRARELAEEMDSPMVSMRPMLLDEDPVTAQVEFRNAFLILWAATLLRDYGRVDGVVFGMLQGETPGDKRPAFTRRLQRIIRDCRADDIYGAGGSFDILTPFRRMTKSEMVRWYLQETGDRGAALLAQSVGCFGASLPMCGRCWSCFNRWIAWQENGLPAERYAADPGAEMLRRFRATWQLGGQERKGLRPGRLWARRRWALECWRQLDAVALQRYQCSAVAYVRRPL